MSSNVINNLSVINHPIVKANNNKDYNKDSFLQYLRKIQKFAILTKEEEEYHTRNYYENQDNNSARILVESHLRLVVKIAGRFKNYGLPIIDLVQEGNLGLIQALKKFEPQKGFRFSTYAMWWIRAFIQDYVLKSWSLVKIGTTTAQKKLFFNLHKIKKRLGIDRSSSRIDDANIKIISETLNVDCKEVSDMDSRLSQGDYSLNHQIHNDENDCIEVGELLASNEDNQEQTAILNQELAHKKQIFSRAFAKLNLREQDILQKRHLSETTTTLDDLSKFYKVSRERIRQIEENAIKKIKKEITQIMENNLIKNC
jgi:RNA polymerase sigma-32 factor